MGNSDKSPVTVAPKCKKIFSNHSFHHREVHIHRDKSQDSISDKLKQENEMGNSLWLITYFGNKAGLGGGSGFCPEIQWVWSWWWCVTPYPQFNVKDVTQFSDNLKSAFPFRCHHSLRLDHGSFQMTLCRTLFKFSRIISGSYKYHQFKTVIWIPSPPLLPLLRYLYNDIDTVVQQFECFSGRIYPQGFHHMLF